MVKWWPRIVDRLTGASFFQHLIKFKSNVPILSAYSAALFPPFTWLYAVTKLPLTVTFSLYIRVIFAMVLLAEWFLLFEALTVKKLIAALTIFSGTILGVATDA
jgi:multidrug transporter EmrE-like cation transporter